MAKSPYMSPSGQQKQQHGYSQQSFADSPYFQTDSLASMQQRSAASPYYTGVSQTQQTQQMPGQP